MRTLNSYETQIAISNAISNKTGKCKCKVIGKVEGMTLTLDEILDFTEWKNPYTKKIEYLLIFDDTPLITISKFLFEKHFDII